MQPRAAVQAVLLVSSGVAGLSRVRQWADFGSGPGHNRTCTRRGPMSCGLSDDEAAFLAGHYDVISLEKCFGGDANQTTENFALTAAQLAASNPQVQVLFYWNARTPGPPRCYEGGAALLDRPDWWLRDEGGAALCVPGPTCADAGMEWPYVDFSVAAAADWWVQQVFAAKERAGANMSGAFLDSVDPWDWADHANVSAARAALWSRGRRAALRRLRDGLKARDPGALVVGNGFGAGNVADVVSLVHDGVLDGLVAEHFMAFETVGDDHTGAVDATRVRLWTDAVRLLPPDAPLLVKAWVGPEVAGSARFPIDAAGPRWPRHFRDPVSNATLHNRTTPAVRAAADHMATWALAAFLCLATRGSLLSYTWWYDVAQGPLWRVPALDVPVGAALGPARFSPDGLRCDRAYEGATVAVNLTRWDDARVLPT